MDLISEHLNQIFQYKPSDDLPPPTHDPEISFLTGPEMKELQATVENWAIPASCDDIEFINEWIRQPENGMMDHTWIIELYAQLIAPHNHELGFMDGSEHSEEVLTSGLFCFLGQIIFFYSQYGLESKTEEEPEKDVWYYLSTIFDFTLLYIHVDHYLDSVKESETDKLATLARMFQLIEDPESYEPPVRMIGLVAAYRRILKEIPESKFALIDLFKTEVFSIGFQSSPDLSREQYLKITELKGGRTASAIQAIMGDKLTSQGYQVGVCVQLLDDLIDVYADKEMGIHTLATHDLVKYGVLDHYVLYTARRIVGLSHEFTIFKLLMMEILTYALSQHDCYTPTIKRRLRRSMHLRYDKGSRMMNIVNGWISQRVAQILRKIPENFPV